MPVGELFLSAFFQVLFDRLTPRDWLHLVLQEGVLSKLNKWEPKLKMIQAVLIDAEEKQLDPKNTAIRMWLDELQDLVYDVEDILDEFATEALRRQLMADQRRVPISTCLTGLSRRAIKFNFSVESKIKDIDNRLEELCGIKNGLGLVEIYGASSTYACPRPTSTSSLIKSSFFGRIDDKSKILEMVLRDEPIGAKFGVIPIVGMGGIGKTALAQEIYNDRAVEAFKLKAWVCVSNDFDVLTISKAILQSMTRSSSYSSLTDLDPVQVELREQVRDNKFLLVLDDVWGEREMNEKWESLKSPFMVAAPGSKTIVTTRHNDVALTMGQDERYKLQLLSEDDCWAIFKSHAFQDRVINPEVTSEFIRKKVVEKCGGLPLAAKTLGGLLYYEPVDEWEDVLKRKLRFENDKILPVLKFSYYHLPWHLKRCFGYCAIFPKNFEFVEKHLVLLWITEGFIQPLEGNMQLEEVGGKYFRDLVSRSLFQKSSRDGSKFVMHDLVHDLAQLVSQRTCLELKDKLGPKEQSIRMARHCYYFSGNYDGKNKFEVLREFKGPRTFLPVRLYDDGPRYITSMVLYDLLPKLKKLRVLSLATYCIVKLPNSIGGFIHLRYLNLSETKIRKLPESTCSLYNLQILLLTDCHDLLKLPAKMRNLINLRHLDITGANLIKEMPLGMKDLTCLQTLSNFIVGKNTGSGLEDLKSLKYLREKLCVSGIDNSQDTRSFILRDMGDLKVLMLEWSSQFHNSQNAAVRKHVLEMLQPHENLEELTIKCYAGTEFPRWVGDPLSLSKMVVLRLESCKNCTSLPSLGLLRSLRDLTIKEMLGIKKIGSELYGESSSESFQSLENLYFEDLKEWENWDPVIENEHVKRYPCLQKLSIKNCPKLSEAPLNHLQSLKRLVILQCGELMVSFSSLPMLCELETDGCKEMVCSSLTDSKLLKSVTLSNSSEFGNWLRQDQSGLTALKQLCINNCDALTSLPEGMNSCSYLECLEIEGCNSLMSIVRDQLPSSLKRFAIRNCKELQYLLDGRDNSSSMIDESVLEYLHISSCPTLTCLSLGGQLLAALKSLEIWNCAKLAALPSRGQLPPVLRHLKIRRCSELIIVRDQLPETLEYLQIDNCPQLELVAGRFHDNMSLHFIRISNCRKIESLPAGLNYLSRLHRIDISDCPSLVSFPEGGLPNHILSVSICNCERLTLPYSMHNLNLLQELSIRQCPNIRSVPDDGFPQKLTSLAIEDHYISKSFVDWGLYRFISLKHLSIGGYSEALSFPQEETLPTSLTKLTIQKFPNLKHISSLQNLNSLEYLLIRECPILTSLPEVGLPSSLLHLCIFDCPMLEKRCKKNRGQEWSKIALIPCVEINHKFINEE